jgi:hypothetical protein
MTACRVGRLGLSTYRQTIHDSGFSVARGLMLSLRETVSGLILGQTRYEPDMHISRIRLSDKTSRLGSLLQSATNHTNGAAQQLTFGEGGFARVRVRCANDELALRY